MAAPPARFPVVPAFREFVRGFAEAGFVWSMTLCTGGLVGGVWAAVQLDEVGIPFLESIRSVIAIEVAVATVGWVGLFSVHLWTELTSVIVEIANNGQQENRAG